MSWSRRRSVAAVLAVTAALTLLSACSGLRPVYGDTLGTSRHAFSYADPGNRIDQVVYDELRLRLGPDTAGEGTIRVSVSTSTRARALTRTAVSKPAASYEMTVTATYRAVAPDGTVLARGSRQASALYTANGQVLADTAAQTDAAERAARSVADSVRLLILAGIETGPQQ